MNILVTGANGMLGQAVVSELLRRGHVVRAMVRPSATIENASWSEDKVDVFRADLLETQDLLPAFSGIDLLVHLAASMSGNEEPQSSSTVVGTENLLKAMAKSSTRDIVLASSYSVYDWETCGGSITEDSPLETLPSDRDGYAISKIMQENLVRSACETHQWRHTILRPGFIWGAPGAGLASVGQKAGPVMLVIGPGSVPPLTHRLNCAHAFGEAVENREASNGLVFNVVDGHQLSTWQFAGLIKDHSPASFLRIPVPYSAGLYMARLAKFASRLVFGQRQVLPSILMPRRYEARFRPVSTSTRLKTVLGWQPPYSLEDCIAHTFGTGSPNA